MIKSLFLPLMLLLASCSCGEDFRLIKSCSWKSDKNIGCVGNDTSYDEVVGEARLDANLGSCEAGTLSCRRNSETMESFCERNRYEEEEQCYNEWTNRSQYDTVCVGYVGPSTESCHDDIDNDCDGAVNEGFDADFDGFMSAHMTSPLNGELKACGADCDDSDQSINPAAAEVCDGIDNNCNTSVDEGLDTPHGSCEPDFPDNINPALLHYGAPSQCRYEPGTIVCSGGGLVCQGAVFVGPTPEMCNGLDDDCDGEVDYTLGMDDGIENEGSNCGTNVGICEYGTTSCMSQDMQCIGGVNPITVMPDSCDGLDTDCDGQTDEDAEPRVCSNGCPSAGVQYCDSGDWTVCDAPSPGDEATDPCNDIDDDCDGAVDEGQECQCDPSEVGPNAPDCSAGEMAESGLSCGTAKKNCICENGDCQYGPCYLTCDPWVNGAPVDVLWGACPAEQCDGWDWNCYGDNRDGMVDVPCECSLNSPVDQIRAAAAQGNGDCEIGQCTAGSQSCEFDNITQTWNMSPLDCGAVGPSEEVCDEIDNDCDTEVDENLQSFERVDMVFIIDITGSMGQEIENIRNAISAYAADFAQTEHRFSLVVFPAPYDGDPNTWQSLGSPATQCGAGNIGNPINPPYLPSAMPYWKMTPVVEVGQFLQALDDVLNIGGLVCSEEPSYDVIDDVSSPSDIANIGWREDAYPYIFFIGDEDAQTWRGLTENALGQRTQTCDGIGMCPCGPPDCDPGYNLLELHCFVGNVDAHDYDGVCMSTNNINNISAPLLRNIFADVCLPTD